jgi:hypothetical protein
MVDAAAEFRAHGHPEESREMLRRFHSWFDSLSPEEAATREHRSLLMDALNLENRHAEALDVIRPLARELPQDVILQGRMGRTAAAAGDTATAREVFARLGGQATPYLFGEDAVWRARIAAILGERERAVALLREALAEGLHHGMWFHRDNSLEPLRGYPPFDEIALPHSLAGAGG